ncbi:uncharacterized protein L969DRAFT_52648 [Mixia osmundae IAM 14324]|uniref:Peptidase C15, pyroglutamyl peptidase I-like protein n=1 Tax=Mixia osmundae (strain CBS 9802 / IAM 14324 / JCM 22182 / KY 12970) TaxID=764103 RepID=G7DS33_MIXOS|nr:uncharacterized protein L969DRAFT_52648 [Mixia osmundae IAM 14324]KEI37552.1 hypothetical protein L969DRAFT_52648 [Mixia osmundae IAM 14324]GAA93393.1 hypothetical protein E5Q_00034 [Mixia osmundae IAM 14324]
MVVVPPSRLDDELQVLVTGFGPFSFYKSNPAWDSVQSLHGMQLVLPASDPASQPTRIRITSAEMPVSFATVLRYIPRLHGLGHGRDDRHIRYKEGPKPATPTCDVPLQSYDLIIHVGVGARDAFKLEQRADKLNYGKSPPDAVGGRPQLDAQTGRCGFLDERWASLPDDLTTRLDVSGLAKELSDSYKIVKSNDPGHYVCEFIYYASLASSRLANPDNSTPVLFVHVPPESEPYSVAEMSHFHQVLIATIVGKGYLPSRRRRNSLPVQHVAARAGDTASENRQGQEQTAREQSAMHLC